MHPRDYIRCVFALFMLASTSEPNRGWIGIPSIIEDQQFATGFNIDSDSLEFVANRISLDWRTLSDWNTGVKSVPGPYQKFTPLPFVRSPLLRPGDYYETEYRGQYMCPSPAHVLWHMQAACEDGLRSVSGGG